MENQSTKDRILDAALTLFAEKGYDGVGVDLIGEQVGMRGPSLYKHFKGKEAILDALLDRMEAYYAAGFGIEAKAGRRPATLQELMDISIERLNFTIHDPQIKKVRRMLAMEQFRNEKLKALTTLHHLTGLENLNAMLLGKLMDEGKVKRYDPHLLALEFTAPVTMMVHLIDREPEREAEAMERIRLHLAHFVEIYAID